MRAGKADKAKALCRQVVKKRPGHAGAMHLLGVIARRQGRLDHAIDLLRRAANADPAQPAYACDLGNAYKAARRFEDAIRAHETALALAPDSAEALSNLGIAYGAWGRHGEAVDHLRRAVDSGPGNAELHYNLGNALMAAGRYEEADAALSRAAGIDPLHIHARANLSLAIKQQGRLDDSIACLRTALASLPDATDFGWNMWRAQGYVLAGWNLGLSLLMTGQHDEGWRWYEQRRELSDFAMPLIEGPAWDGAPLEGRTLLIHHEQGLGDTIQFIRYAPLAAKSGGPVIVQCQQPLKTILGGVAGGSELVGASDPQPAFDVQAPLMSLPHLLRRPEPVCPASGAYLSADPGRIRNWANRIGGDGFKIGIAWQGNAGYRDDGRRSVPLRFFEPLRHHANVRLFSLQKGDGEDQFDALPWRDAITNLAPDLDNDAAFIDTAAVMAGLDLVVTSDTSIAHLAGALGVPVWLLLADIPDWRWGLTGDTTPWYPTMRLFRQTAPGDWDGVFRNVAKALADRRG